MSSVKSNKIKLNNNKHKAKKVRIVDTVQVFGQSRRSRGKRQKRGNRPSGPGNWSNGGSGRIGLSGSGNFATTRRSQVIEEDEYIAEINGSTAYAVTQYAVNPGNATTFPWGNKIASLYEEYDFEYLEFYYKREVSEYATNGQAGKVILSFDYDASDSAPTSKQQVEDTVPHSDGMPSTPIIRLPLDPRILRGSMQKHYVRPSAQPANTDIKMYDVGNLNVSTTGNSNTTVLGELHVRYRVKLSVPVLEPSLSNVGGAAHFSSVTSTSASNFAGMALQGGATGNPALITLAGDTVTFPAGIPGNYFLAFSIAAATSASAVNFQTVTGGVTLLQYFTGGAARDAYTQAVSLGGTTISSAMSNVMVSVTAAGGTLVLGTPSTLVTSGTSSTDLWIISMPTSIITSKPVFPPSDLLKRIARLEQLLEKDSEFEEESKEYDPSSTPIKSTSTSLSNSTVDLIGELLARKNVSKMLVNQA